MNELKASLYNRFNVSSTKDLKKALVEAGVEVFRYDFRRKSDWQMLCKKFGIKSATKKQKPAAKKSPKKSVAAERERLLAEHKQFNAELKAVIERLQPFSIKFLPAASSPIALLAPAA
jgi:hypothetical protein